MRMGNIYSASDKSLFDALTQSAVTNADLRSLFLRYGIIISKDTSRRQLAKHLSRLILDYDAFQAITRLFDTGLRKERVSCVRVKSIVKFDVYEAAVHRLAVSIIDDGDFAKVVTKEGEPIRLEVTYRKFRFDRNEFRQIVTRGAEIIIEERSGVVMISGPQNDDVGKWFAKVIADVQSSVSEPLDLDEVNLEGNSSAEARTRFFTTLIKNNEGYSFVDVSDVYLHQPKGSSKEIQISDEGDDDPISLDAEGEDGETGDVHISRAALRGQGVLVSKQASDLLAQGFYIARIVWTAKTSYFDSDLYEFEAQFGEPDTCTAFSYAVKGFYPYRGNGEHNTTRSQLTKAEDIRLARLIEDAAHTVLITL